ncbi:YibE/F family protein [Candidatus Roizmanbacteria bacterium]|nr:YibE/F family protein [Candidatus Roizmanbacteria bacterium]
MKSFALTVLLVIFIFLSSGKILVAQSTDEILEGTITEIPIEEQRPVSDGSSTLYQKLSVLVTKGSLQGETITIENGTLPYAHIEKYGVGDRVVIQKTQTAEGTETYMITDYVRRGALAWLFVIFVLLVIAIGGKWGIASLLGMGISFLIIMFFMLPRILNGAPPVVISLISSLVIVPVTFYLSHGFNAKTHIAIFGTLATLSITGMIASLTIDTAHLTGYATEEAGFLEVQRAGTINMQGLLLAGIIIGVLGVLDDVTVSQAAIVQQLKKANVKFHFQQLFSRAMSVGRDHIASLVNTLVLVYTGASLPLLLLFINNPRPFSEIINYEFVSDEIIRTLVGSIGLVLAVPITTAVASFIFSRGK